MMVITSSGMYRSKRLCSAHRGYESTCSSTQTSLIVLEDSLYALVQEPIDEDIAREF